VRYGKEDTSPKRERNPDASPHIRPQRDAPHHGEDPAWCGTHGDLGDRGREGEENGTVIKRAEIIEEKARCGNRKIRADHRQRKMSTERGGTNEGMNMLDPEISYA